MTSNDFFVNISSEVIDNYLKFLACSEKKNEKEHQSEIRSLNSKVESLKSEIGFLKSKPLNPKVESLKSEIGLLKSKLGLNPSVSENKILYVRRLELKIKIIKIEVDFITSGHSNIVTLSRVTYLRSKVDDLYSLINKG